MIARHREPVGCARVGCGSLARAGSIYCDEGCRFFRGSQPGVQPQDDSDLDLHALTLREKLAGGGPLTRRIARYGTHPCRGCGRETIPGRLYCSESCRAEARQRPQVVELDGEVLTVLGHAERLGIGRSTLYRRLQLGLSLEDALKRPVDPEMRRRAVG